MKKDPEYYREGGDLFVLVEETLFRASYSENIFVY
jgi:hypothetical protein